MSGTCNGRVHSLRQTQHTRRSAHLSGRLVAGSMVWFWHWWNQTQLTDWLTLLNIYWVSTNTTWEPVGETKCDYFRTPTDHLSFLSCEPLLQRSTSVSSLEANRCKALSRHKPTIYFSCHQNSNHPEGLNCMWVQYWTERWKSPGCLHDSHKGRWKVN